MSLVSHAPPGARTLNSLGLPKPPRETRVVAAMSGGVDSSVVAAMLAREGYDVVGVTLQLYDHGAAVNKPGACCAGQDIHDARRVADSMGFPHYVLDYESRFREAVMEDFADTYLAGPAPISTAPPTPARIKPISCSPPRANNSTSCVSRLATNPRAKCACSPPNSA